MLMGSFSSLRAKFACFRSARVCLSVAASALVALGGASSAAAYQTDSVASDPCHERITSDALRRVRAELPDAAKVMANNDDERALVADVPFSVDADMREFGSVSVILGNRDLDLKGHEPDDLDELAPIHGDPRLQSEHCLRSPGQDEPTGSEQALASCREIVQTRALRAIDGLLSDSSAPDPAQRATIEVFLELRGSVDVDLPVYHVELGRALHTLQDGFSHTYRDPADQRLVTVVLNYVDFAEKRLNEAVDGPPHSSSLDQCKNLDAFRNERLELAIQASADLIDATLDPELTREQKQAAVDEVITRYLSFENKGCSLENNWCDAHEKTYPEERGCVCELGRGSAPGAGGFVAFAALLAFGWRRARRRVELDLRRSKRAWIVGALILVAPATVTAQQRDSLAPARGTSGVGWQSRPPQQAATASSTPSAAGFEGRDPEADARLYDSTPDSSERKGSKFGVVVAGAGAIENGGLAASVGVVYRPSPPWLIGLEGEYNPWFSARDFELKPGSTNLYASGVLRFPLRYQRVNLRSTLQLGVSRMNFDLFGVPEGSIGPYVGFNVLGVDYEMARSMYLIVNPAHIAVPIPKLSGTPFYYPQYRFTIGLQFGA